MSSFWNDRWACVLIRKGDPLDALINVYRWSLIISEFMRGLLRRNFMANFILPCESIAVEPVWQLLKDWKSRSSIRAPLDPYGSERSDLHKLTRSCKQGKSIKVSQRRLVKHIERVNTIKQTILGDYVWEWWIDVGGLRELRNESCVSLRWMSNPYLCRGSFIANKRSKRFTGSIRGLYNRTITDGRFIKTWLEHLSDRMAPFGKWCQI